jgi:hypothetical protein
MPLSPAMTRAAGLGVEVPLSPNGIARLKPDDLNHCDRGREKIIIRSLIRLSGGVVF